MFSILSRITAVTSIVRDHARSRHTATSALVLNEISRQLSRQLFFSSGSTSRHHHRLPSPGPPPPPKFRKRTASPPAYRYSASQSPVHRNGGRNGHKSRSPEKIVERRRRSGSRAVEPSAVLGVFGLHVRTSEGEIRDIFERFGPVDKIHMVYDAKSRGFRGYCFIYYTKIRDATAALNETNGLEVKERRIRVDFSKTKRAHTPTPGFYRGNRGQRNRSFERQRPPRRDYSHSTHDRIRRDEHPRRVERERPHREVYREREREREIRPIRSDVRRRSMDRMPRRSPPRREARDSFRRRDRS